MSNLCHEGSPYPSAVRVNIWGHKICITKRIVLLNVKSEESENVESHIINIYCLFNPIGILQSRCDSQVS